MTLDEKPIQDLNNNIKKQNKTAKIHVLEGAIPRAPLGKVRGSVGSPQPKMSLCL